MLKRAIAAAAAIAGVGLLSGCDSFQAYAAHDPLPGAGGVAKPTSAPAKPGTPATPAASRCTKVPVAEQKTLRALLKPGIKGTKFAAVRSTDFDQVYMVAVRLSGTGVGTNYNAVFATDTLNGTGQTFAVDGFAQEFSSLGEQVQQGVTTDADGVSEAQGCVARSADAGGGAGLPG
jgi:hypothetical protein